MYWAIIVFWVLAAVMCSALVLFFGLRFSLPLYEWWSNNNSNAPDAPANRRTPAPTPTPPPNTEHMDARSLEGIKDKVFSGEYTSVNIGGAVLVTGTFAPEGAGLEPDKVRHEEVALLFRQVSDREALVNVALEGKVKIEDVRLHTTNKEKHEFKVEILVKNQTAEDVWITIPQGQIIEQKVLERKRERKQNLATRRGDRRRIPASTGPDSPVVKIEIAAACVSPGLKYPEGEKGNLTIFELKNKSLLNKPQEEVSKWLVEMRNLSDRSQLLIR